jgi:HAD superfamily 5'-nucleotidase-like hydrolase
MSDRELEDDIEALLGEVRQEIDISRRRRIFCNRNLKMESIELIGFDMDYTLALYQQERLEQLSIELTLKKLIENRGYPKAILDLTYDSKLAIRGIVIDRQHGNVFKMDKHGYVGRVYHGMRELSEEESTELYRRHTKIRL